MTQNPFLKYLITIISYLITFSGLLRISLIFFLIFVGSFLSLIYAQVIIKEKIELKPDLNSYSVVEQLTDTALIHKINFLEKPKLKDPQLDNPLSTVIMPFYGRTTVEVILSDAAASSRISLEIRQPEYQILSEYANQDIGFKWSTSNLLEGTAVEFGIDWYWNYWGTIYQGKEAGVITTQIDSTEYTMGFEALGDDWDYNELVIRVKFVPSDIVAMIEPPVIFPGDTANIIIKNRLPDGTLIDFPPDQLFELGMLDGCILGKLKADADSGAYLNSVLQPICFIADTGMDSGVVLIRVGIVEENLEQIQNGFLERTDCFTGNFISQNYNDANLIIGNLIEIVYPLPLITERITQEPAMPEVICKAKLKRFYPGVIKFEWKYIVKKEYLRRDSDSGPLICERFSRSEFRGLSYSESGGLSPTEWTVPFIKDSGIFYFKSIQPKQNKYHPKDYYGCNGEVNYWYDETSTEIFTGGEVFITITAKDYHTGEIIAKIENYPSGRILGTDPSDIQIDNYANSNKIKAIKFKESKSHQYTFEGMPSFMQWPFDCAGWPIYGEPNGYGLMQLDNNPGATERQLWNWKANIDGAKAKLIYCYDEVKENHGTPEDLKCNITNQFQFYHKGKKSNNYYKWRFNKWTLNPNRETEYGKEVYIKYLEYGGGN